MHQVNPALIICDGACAEQIGKRAKELIVQRYKLESVPPIFQFLRLRDNRASAADEIRNAYARVLSIASAASSERAIRNALADEAGVVSPTVSQSRIESFVIAPLQSNNYKKIFRAAQVLDKCALESIGGGRNAILLTAKKLLSLKAASLIQAARYLDLQMPSNLLPFNRCFLVDEVNENGQRFASEKDLVEMVAQFIFLSIASDLSGYLKDNPASYFGDSPGAYHRAFASFSCNKMSPNTQGFITVLGDRLATDICRNYFREVEPEIRDSKTWKEGLRWFNENIRKPLTSHENTTLEKLTADVDYQDAEKRFDEFSWDIYTAVNFNLKAYRAFAEDCLEQGLIALETVYERLRKIKAEIAELLILIMLNPKEEIIIPSNPEIRRYWLETILFWFLGLVAIVYTITASGSEAQTQNDYGWVGIFGGIASLAIGTYFFFKKKVIEKPPVTQYKSPPYLEMLAKKRQEYADQCKLLNVHFTLFTRLDKACFNIDALQAELDKPRNDFKEEIFDFDLLDKSLADKFYIEKYNAERKKNAIEGFISPGAVRELHRALLSYPDVRLSNYLREYSKQCFMFINNYSLEQVCDMRKSLKAQQEFLSPPFWNPPISSMGERMLFVSLGEPFQDGVRSVLEDMFGSRIIKFSNNQNLDEITFVQVRSGIELRDLFDFTRTDPLEMEDLIPSWSSTGEVGQQVLEQLEDTITGKIREVLGVPLLSNYQGVACVAIYDQAGVLHPPAGREVTRLPRGKPYRLEFWLQPDKAEGAFSEPVNIYDGQDTKEVNFEIMVDSNTLEFAPDRDLVKVQPDQPSHRAAFVFTAEASPNESGEQPNDEHEVWVNVFQKNRLIQIIRVIIKLK